MGFISPTPRPLRYGNRLKIILIRAVQTESITCLMATFNHDSRSSLQLLAVDPQSQINDAERSRFIDDIYRLVTQFGGYVATRCMFEEKLCLLISHENLYNHPPFGMMSRCRISVTEFQYVVHVMMKEVERGSLEQFGTNKVLYLCNKYATNSQAYKFCPGIDAIEYERQREIIRFDLKSVRKMSEPFLRVDSVNCLLWFELSKSSTMERRKASAVLCPPCTRLKCDIARQVSRTQEESPSAKKRRQHGSSHARLSYMSPSSQMERKANQRKERQIMKRKLEYYEEQEIPLDDQQSDEMNSVISIIEGDHRDQLENLFAEGTLLTMVNGMYVCTHDVGDEHGVGHKLRDAWKTDRQRESNDFRKDQVINSEFFVLYNF